MMVNRKLLAVVAAAAAAVALAACGSSSSGGTATTPSGTTTTASTGASATSAAGSTVTIGVVCSCSGPFGSTIVDANKVSQAWEKSVNASGGLNGHQIKLIEIDDKSTPATSVAAAQTLISDKVSAILDLTILDAAWIKQVDAAKIPVIGGGFSSEQYYTDPNWYPSGQTNDSIVYSVVATAKTAGATSLGQLYCAESPQCALSVKPVEAAGTKLGVPVKYNASIAATAPNFTAQCLAAKQKGVTALFIGDSISVIARVATDCDKQGYDPIYVTEGTGYTNQALTTPGLKDKLWSPFPILPFYSTAPAVTAMNTVLDKYFPGMRQDTNAWSEFAVQAWTGAQLIGTAVKSIPSGTAVDNTAMTTALDATSNETLGGFSPTLTFAAGQPHPVDCWYTGRVQGGQASQVGGQICQKGS